LLLLGQLVPVAPARDGPPRRGPCRAASGLALLRVTPVWTGAGALRVAPPAFIVATLLAGALRVAPPAFNVAPLRTRRRPAAWQRLAPLRVRSPRVAWLRAGPIRVAQLRPPRRRLAAPAARLPRAARPQVTLRARALRVVPPASPAPFMRGPLRAGASRVALLAGGMRVALLRAGALLRSGALRVAPPASPSPFTGELVRVTLLRAALPRITPLRAGPLRVAGLRRRPLRGTPLQPARRSALGRAVIVSAGPGI